MMRKLKKRTVYIIKFKDGTEYIGQTSKTLKDRMWYHEHKPCNNEVWSRLLNKMPYHIVPIRSYMYKKHANMEELRLIKERSKEGNLVLNKRGLTYPFYGK